jgi:putative hydrolase of the HAD superfamily
LGYTHVIFDFGGVITSSPFEAFNRMEAQRGLPRDFVRRVNSANPDDNAWAKFERAEIDAAGFDVAFAAEAEALGQSLDGVSVIACLAGDIRPYMVTALDRLKAGGFGIGCITNNVKAGSGAGMARDADKAAQVSAIMARFDHVIESSKARFRKPDPRIYQMMCDLFSVEASACIYLDDLGINCKPAAMLGMHAIKVIDGERALADLEAALNMPLR